MQKRACTIAGPFLFQGWIKRLFLLLILFDILLCVLGCFCLRGGPVVQVVGDVMAVAAFGELGHHWRWVRHAVAALACRNHLVFVLVAVNARQ